MTHTQFTRLENGREVAYRQLTDSDGPAIVHLTSATIPIEVLGEDPLYDRFLRTLGRYGRLVVIDRPGVGASDPLDPEADLVDQAAAAYLTVLDALGPESAWLVMGASGMITARLAARHPERLDGAALLSPPALVELSDPNWARWMKVLERDEEVSEEVHQPSTPSRADDPAYREWNERAARLGASASAARALREAYARSATRFLNDPEPITESPPVLVIHRREATSITIEDCEWWANQFPGAELLLLEGADVTFQSPDAGVLADTIGSFITGDRVQPVDDRPLVALLFVDIVESTRRVSDVGDERWRGSLDRSERLVETTVNRHGGTLVKHTGDGALATFTTGSRACAAAISVRASIRELDLECRIGIHLGEVEMRGDDVGGLAVHLAARVMSAAQSGQILVSSTVAQTTVGASLTLVPVGETELKGIDQPWELFALRERSD